MSWILLLVYCGLFLFLIHKLDFFRLEGIPKWMTQSFFMAKILAGIALWAVYTFYYPDRSTADIWKYFDDGKVMRDAARESPADFLKMLSGFGDGDPRIHASYYSVMQHWDLAFDQDLPNEAHTLIRWNSLLHFISMGNYHIHSVFMCFLSFIGLCALYRTFYSAFQHHNKIAAAIIFLFPSLLFWSSGVLKEGLVVFALGFLLYNAFLFLSGKRIIHFAIVVIMLLLLFLTRFYVLFALIPALAGALWVHHNEKRAWLKFSIVLFACLALGWAVKFIQPEYDLLRVIALKQNDFLRLARGGTVLFDDDTVAYVEPGFRDRVFERNGNWHIQENTPVTYYHIATDFKDTVRAYHKYKDHAYQLFSDRPPSGSLMEADFLEPRFSSILKALPGAFYRTLFRPYLWEAKKPLFIFPALENIFFILIVILIFIYPQTPSHASLFGFCLVFSILLIAVAGLTTPVLGALVRYRSLALPFLFLGLLMLLDLNKLMSRLQKGKTVSGG